MPSLRTIAQVIAEAVVFWGCLAVVGFVFLVLAPAAMTTAVLP